MTTFTKNVPDWDAEFVDIPIQFIFKLIKVWFSKLLPAIQSKFRKLFVGLPLFGHGRFNGPSCR